MFETHGPAFSVGTALRLSFVAWFRNFIPFTVLTAIVYVPLLVWGAVATSGTPDPADLLTLAALLGPISLLLNFLLAGALTYGVVMDLRGERASIVACVGVGLRRALPVFGVTLLMLLAIFGASLLLVIPGIIVTTMLYVSVPASILERPGIMGALRRSRELTKGRRWGIFALYLLSTIGLSLSSGGLQIAMLGELETATVSQWKPYLLAELGRMVLLGPLAAVIPAVAYFLLRQEKEGTSAKQLGSIFE